uniref:Uncharacterized protein n=1 Tax=Panagrolaimus sp. PS1159 TaxID=55785 RepID=A0AC35FM49_9BILA
MPEIIPTIITGKKRVLQIILDSHRKHYILIEWHPKYKDRGAIIWDPLIRSNKDFISTLSKSFKRQYLRLFDHIYGTPIDGNASDSKSNTIPCKLESFVYGQNDNWSCGLRAAATLVLRAFNGEQSLHGGEIYISIRKFHEILKKIMNLERKPTKEDFQINYWFKRKNYEYDFAFVLMNKSDLAVYCTYQNYDKKEKNFVKDDENDDISKIKRKLASLKLSAKKSKKVSDDDEDEDEDESTTLLSSSSASSEAGSDNEVEGDESQASNHQQQNNDNEDDEEKAADKSLKSSSSHSSAQTTDDPN